MIRKSRKPVQVLDPHFTACEAPLDALSLIEPLTLAASARPLSEPEAVLVTAAAAEVEEPAPDIVIGGRLVERREKRRGEERGEEACVEWVSGWCGLVR